MDSWQKSIQQCLARLGGDENKLAAILESSQQTINDWKLGKNEPRDKKRERLQKKIDALLSGKSGKGYENNPIIIKLRHKWNASDEVGRARLIIAITEVHDDEANDIIAFLKSAS